jgi:hypothetical protein
LFEVLVGTETFGFTDIVLGRLITVYLEPLENIITTNINPGVDSQSNIYIPTKSYADAVQNQQIEIIHSLFVDKMYVTEFQKDIFKDLQGIRQKLVSRSFFDHTINVIDDLRAAATQPERSTIKEKDLILQKQMVVQRILTIAHAYIAIDVANDRNIGNIYSKIQGEMTYEALTGLLDTLVEEISSIKLRYPKEIETFELYSILRSKYLKV